MRKPDPRSVNAVRRAAEAKRAAKEAKRAAGLKPRPGRRILIDGHDFRIDGIDAAVARAVMERAGEEITNGRFALAGRSAAEACEEYARSPMGVAYAVYLRVRNAYRFKTFRELTEQRVFLALLENPEFRAAALALGLVEYEDET